MGEGVEHDIRAHAGPHPLDARPRQRRQGGSRTCFRSAEGGTIDWRKRWSCCARAPGQYPLLLELREVRDITRIRLTRRSDVFGNVWRACQRPDMNTRITIAEAAAPRRRDRRDRRLALQPAQVRQDRLSAGARRHGNHAVRGGEERAAGRGLRGAEEPDAGIVADRRGKVRAEQRAPGRLRDGRGRRRDSCSACRKRTRIRSRRRITASSS